MKRVSRRSKIHRGRDANDGVELLRHSVAKFASKFEHEVSAHRVADQRDGLEAVLLDEEAHHHQHVTRQSRVIERRTQRFGAAAVAHVHADDVASALPQLVGVSNDVLRVRRAFEAMHDDRRGPRCTHLFRLPMAFAAHLACDLAIGRRRDLDELRLRGRQIVGAGR